MLMDEQTVQTLKLIVQKKGMVRLPASGKSMYPLIQQGDICEFVQIDPQAIEKGDIILFITEGQLVAHRFFQKNQEHRCLFKGDANLGFDQPVSDEQLIGKLVKIKRKDKTISLNSLIPAVWGKLIGAFPFISMLINKKIVKA